MSEEVSVVYLPNKGGWYWTQRNGNRIEYHGPFRNRVDAEKAAKRNT